MSFVSSDRSRSFLATLLSRSAARFDEDRINPDSRIASKDTINVSRPYGKGSILNPIHTPQKIRWRNRNRGFPDQMATVSDIISIFFSMFLMISSPLYRFRVKLLSLHAYILPLV